MTQNSYGVQVVKLTDDHKFELDTKELEQILLRDDIKDLPVAVISIAGAYRLGKSFILNFFIRYLSAPLSARVDGTWLGDGKQALKGFSWRGGSKRNTTGILLWSEPFIVPLPSGEKVAVLIMDTQGTFDSSSTMRDSSTIFALSTLLSSIQIYNVSGNIKEDDLEHLELFTEYGRQNDVKGESGKAFQVLEFLVRDWANSWEYEYGAVGGKIFVDERLQDDPTLAPEVRDLRAHIRSSFEKICCYLMPHPGLEVAGGTFKGATNEITPSFKQHLLLLASSIFEPEKLQPKLIKGETVKAKQLFTFFQTYMTAFNNNKITIGSMTEATNEGIILTAYLEELERYEKNMSTECEGEKLSVPQEYIKKIHDRYKTVALNNFTAKKTMGAEDRVKQMKQKLSEECDKRAGEFAMINKQKYQKAVKSAIEAYDADIAKFGNVLLLCVHPTDVRTIHSRAYETALHTFDAARKWVPEQIDNERDIFKKDLEEKYKLLEQRNNDNNETAITECETEYSQYMANTTYVEPPLSSSELHREHEVGRSKALESFEAHRNIPDSYIEDVFKGKLIDNIEEQFESLCNINNRKHKNLINRAFSAYTSHMKRGWDQTKECLHPDEFLEKHADAQCKAKNIIRQENSCSAEFDSDNEDENVLETKIHQEYRKLHAKNCDTNEKAMKIAVEAYKKSYIQRTRYFSWFSTSGDHARAKADAFRMFYSHRRRGGNISSDIFIRDLEAKLNRIYDDGSY